MCKEKKIFFFNFGNCLKSAFTDFKDQKASASNSIYWQLTLKSDKILGHENINSFSPFLKNYFKRQNKYKWYHDYGITTSGINYYYSIGSLCKMLWLLFSRKL